MSDGIQWLADAWNAQAYYVTFARGISPHELAIRLGADPQDQPRYKTAREAGHMANEHEYYTVARIGECAGWSFAVEVGAGSNAWQESDVISRGGVEVVHLNPQPDHPPSQFSYARDGVMVCFFPFLWERTENGGTEPDLLVPAMKRAGVLDEDGKRIPWGDGTGQDSTTAEAKTFAAIEEHFGLSLPKEAVITGHLKAVMTVSSEPRFW
jgi:hypothetical protein